RTPRRASPGRRWPRMSTPGVDEPGRNRVDPDRASRADHHARAPDRRAELRRSFDSTRQARPLLLGELAEGVTILGRGPLVSGHRFVKRRVVGRDQNALFRFDYEDLVARSEERR